MSENNQYLPVGYRIRNHYEIVSVLGQGGFGIVYLVKDIERLNEKVVIKELFAKDFSSRNRDGHSIYNRKSSEKIFQKIKEDIRDEVNILRNIENRNIVKAYGCFEENNTIYSIMEYIDGEDLEIYIKRGSFNEQEARELLLQLIHGLNVIHSKGIIHRDIKPNNIIKTPNGIYKIIDFTTNRSYTDGATTTITAFQNPIYTPPELTQRETTIGKYSDIYSIGMTIVSLLVKYRNNLPNLTDRLLDNSGFLTTINRLNISVEFRAILEKMTELKFKNRFQNLGEIERLLSRIDIDTVIDFDTYHEKETEASTVSSSDTLSHQQSSSWFKNSVIFLLLGVIAFGGYKFYEKEKKSKISISTSTPRVELLEIATPKPIITKAFSRENIREFLKSCLMAEESNSPEQLLPFYASNINRYFSLTNITRKEVYADKERYYNKWYQRKYTLIDFSILDTYSRDGIDYCDITQTINWKVKSLSHSKSGKSVNLSTLKKSGNKFQITSISNISTVVDSSPTPTLPPPPPLVPIVDTKKIDTVRMDNNNLTLKLSYSPNIKRGKKVQIKASLYNSGKKEKRGGVTLSFPQIYDIAGDLYSNDFDKLQKYGTSDKVYNKDKGKPIHAKYLMIESNDETWLKGEEHTFSMQLDVPKGINKFKIQVRGALRKRVVPSYGIKDQQGYFCKVITINIID